MLTASHLLLTFCTFKGPLQTPGMFFHNCDEKNVLQKTAGQITELIDMTIRNALKSSRRVLLHEILHL